jgi:hypothetical protein|eukprot:626286-Prymnesium_polylepis.1
MPFICDMDYTLEDKGAKRVAINQLGPALSKRQLTAQVCLRAEPPPPYRRRARARPSRSSIAIT